MSKETTKTRARKVASVLPTKAWAMQPVAEQTFPDPEMNLRTLAQVLVGLQSNRRQATAHTKSRGEVAGTTRKPWRQKGTGRARVGTRRNPIWRGGGRAFGPTNRRNFSKKINKQLVVPALWAVLSGKARRGEVMEIGELPAGPLSTRAWLAGLSGALDPRSNLLVMAESDICIRRAVRNLSYLRLTTAKDLNALSAAAARKIIFLPGALSILRKRG